MQGEFYKGEDLGASYNKNNTASGYGRPQQME